MQGYQSDHLRMPRLQREYRWVSEVDIGERGVVGRDVIADRIAGCQSELGLRN